MNNETKLMSVRDAIIMAMSEEMRSDENVFLMGEDVGIFGGDFGTSVGMLEEFGAERIRDTPISENAISGCAIGAAMTGMRPIVDVTFMDFVVYMMDNIVNQAAKTRYMFGGKGQVPVVFRCAAGSGVGSAAQHSQSLESWFCHIPGLKVVAPGTPADVKGLLKDRLEQAKERLAESPDVLERLNEAWAMERKNKLELLTARNNQAQIVPRHRSKWIRTGIRAAIVPFVIFCIMALFLMPRAYIQMSERMNGTDVVRFLVTSILAIVLCFVIGYVFARLIDQNKADGIRKERADAERLERELAAKGEQLHEVRTGYQLQDTKRREIQSDVNAREDLVAQTIYKLQVMEEAMRMLE